MLCNLPLLRSRLGQFGLNPMDWCVEVRSRHGHLLHLEVTPNGDHALRFEGWAMTNDWLTLEAREI